MKQFFQPLDEKNDPEKIGYKPFHIFSEYLISIGYSGVAYQSTRMKLLKQTGNCLVLFDKNDATYSKGTMQEIIY